MNQKRVYRLYREEGLQIRRRCGRKRAVRPRQAVEAADQRWSIDPVHDELATGRRLLRPPVVDDHTRESVAIFADHSIPAERV